MRILDEFTEISKKYENLSALWALYHFHMYLIQPEYEQLTYCIKNNWLDWNFTDKLFVTNTGLTELEKWTGNV